MSTKTHKVGFTITGEFVTEHARDLLCENDWEGAYRFLTDCILGMDHPTAVSILRGECKIAGETGYGKENTLELVKESKKTRAEIEAQMKYLWAGIVRERPDYWRPYAYIDNWGPHDVGAAERYHNTRYERGSTEIPIDFPNNKANFIKWGKSRSCEYMNDPANDRAELVEVDGETQVVLFEKVNAPPIWYAPIPPQHGCWAEAVLAYRSGDCVLQSRGHNQSYGTKKSAREIAEEVKERLSDSLPNNSFDDSFLKTQMASQMAQFGMDAEAAEGVLSYALGDVEEKPPTPDDPKNHNYGWITLNGKFYGCMYHHHAMIAKCIWKFIEKTTDEDVLADPEKAGDHAGWIKVTKSALDGQYKMMCEKKPNAKQLTTLKEWAIWHHQDPDNLEIFNG